MIHGTIFSNTDQIRSSVFSVSTTEFLTSWTETPSLYYEENLNSQSTESSDFGLTDEPELILVTTSLHDSSSDIVGSGSEPNADVGSEPGLQ
ncbi:hypothetical protein SNE40_003054 [Patella caerulea]|uniref:Uncharacterized protein n=1 Tax=Patella caerulea TaxID=87958 RepID=A0AAN8K8Y2_PATCE